jgi:hypothetical protein
MAADREASFVGRHHYLRKAAGGMAMARICGAEQRRARGPRAPARIHL